MNGARFAVSACFATTLGCGVQLGAGTTPSHIPSGRSAYVTTGIQSQRIRVAGSIVGLRVTSLPDSAGLHVRNAVLNAGYSCATGPSSPFGFEASGELGAGGSAFPRFSGMGMYLGVAPALRWRLAGDRDREQSYNIMLTYWDLVATARGGVWAGPEAPGQHQRYAEWALELALRFSFASDVLGARSQSVGNAARNGDEQ